MTFPQAYSSLDLDTLVLLFAMIVVNVNLAFTGFFRVIADRVLHWAHTPKQLLASLSSPARMNGTASVAACFFGSQAPQAVGKEVRSEFTLAC